jgi:hypothetical protein
VIGALHMTASRAAQRPAPSDAGHPSTQTTTAESSADVDISISISRGTRQVTAKSSELPTDDENGTLGMSENRVTARTDETRYAVNVCAADNSE